MNLKLNFKIVLEDRMKKRIMMFVLALMLLCGSALAENLTVVATNFPCYDLARQIAGEQAEVKMLIRPGTEVHSFEPSPSDILAIGNADLFVYIGGESDAWADDILDSFGADVPQTVRLMDDVVAVKTEHEHEEEHEHDAHHSDLDEHIWTSPKNTLLMLRAVENALCEIQPENADSFHVNADAYALEIEAIDQKLESIVANGQRDTLVFADRFPFVYLVNDYHLNYVAAFASCTSETEPSAQTMVQLIQTIAQIKAPVVYTIEMSTGTIAKTIAEETGVEILTLHSAQTVTQEEFEAGETYVSLMQKNLDAIEKGLN